MPSSTLHNIQSPSPTDITNSSDTYDSSTSNFTATLIPPSNTVRSIDPTARGAMPSTSRLLSFPKLGDCDIFQWKRNVCGYIKAVGLGVFLRSSVIPPVDSDSLEKFEMQQEQVMLVIRSTLDAVHAQHISSIDDPYLAIIALESRHGVTSGLAAANVMIKIVTSRYNASTKLEDYVSSMQALQNQLAKTVAPTSNLKLSDQILALFLLISLPKDEFSSMTQQLLGDIENV